MPGRFEFLIVGPPPYWTVVDHFWSDSINRPEQEAFWRTLYGPSVNIMSALSLREAKAEATIRRHVEEDGA